MTATMTTAGTFERSLAQRMQALDRANEIRVRRAALKRDLRAGRTTAVATLIDPPEYLQTAKVLDLLLAVPKVGRVRANRELIRCGISPSKTVAGLSDRQRRELVTGPLPLGAAVQSRGGGS
jgi:hypothetical protein